MMLVNMGSGLVRDAGWSRMDSSDILELPGGLLVEDRVERRAFLRPITGSLEQHIAETLHGMALTPSVISQTLSLAVDEIGGEAVDCEVAGRLSVADRQVLMLRLGSLVGEDQVWLRPECESCQMPFDVGFQRSAIPVEPAGHGYPYAQRKLGENMFKLRVPTGKDQEAVSSLNGEAAIRALAKRCIVSVDGAPPSDELLNRLSMDDISEIEVAIEAISPMVAEKIHTNCAECGHSQAVALDPYTLTGGERTVLYQEVHTLACHYHWSEAEILALPRERRQLYLAMIDRARGVYA